MGIRETLSENKRFGVGVAALLLMTGVVALGYQYAAMKTNPSAPQAFYTIDEGKTLFTDTPELVPPFNHGGQQAVRAYVYECDGKRFVAYLERFTEDARRMIAELDEAVKRAKPGDKPPANLGQLTNARRNGREVKKPGDANWVHAGSKEGARITSVQTAPGMTGTPELVQP